MNDQEPQPQTDAPPAPPVRPKPGVTELRRRFFYHPPRDDTARQNHEIVSELCFKLASNLVEITPSGRNQSLMLTALEDVRMRANAAIAVDDPRP